MAKLYTELISDNNCKAKSISGNEFIEIELYAFNNSIGCVFLQVMKDNKELYNQYIVLWKHDIRDENEEAIILMEGHKKEGIIQKLKAKC